MAIVAAQYAYMVSSDFESPEARYALGPYTPVDPRWLASCLLTRALSAVAHARSAHVRTCTCACTYVYMYMCFRMVDVFMNM